VIDGLIAQALDEGVLVGRGDASLIFGKGKKSIVLAEEHYLYGFDVAANFDFYFEAVEAREVDGHFWVDYSTARLHRYVGFDDYCLMTPSLAEPLATTSQYLHLAGPALSEGGTVLDLGAYSGLSAIMFQRVVGTSGRVIAVEADPFNASCATINFQFELIASGVAPTLEQAAVWSADSSVLFSAESNMGGSAVEYAGSSRGSIISVAAITLSSLARKHSLTHIDLIKLDIEGAEREALSDAEFFARFRPVVILEAHSDEAAGQSEMILRSYGYSVDHLAQPGTPLHLLVAHADTPTSGP
jgi:FkbM family methyltransferase